MITTGFMGLPLRLGWADLSRAPGGGGGRPASSCHMGGGSPQPADRAMLDS